MDLSTYGVCRGYLRVFLTILGLTLVSTSYAQAQLEVPPGRAVQIDTERGRDLPFYLPVFVTGSVLFLGAYVPSLIYAESPSYNAGTALKYPIVGPWIDLSKQDCVTNNCSATSTNGAFLIADGVVQGIGVLTMAASFLMPERKVRRWRERRVMITPLRTGLGAWGRF